MEGRRDEKEEKGWGEVGRGEDAGAGRCEGGKAGRTCVVKRTCNPGGVDGEASKVPLWWQAPLA
eukprot:296530-Chlamydomonas_euryale.AAC.2